MTGAAIIRRLYGEHAAKAIANENGVSISAAKKWLIDGPPPARLDAILSAAQARLDRRLAELAELEGELQRLRTARRGYRGPGGS